MFKQIALLSVVCLGLAGCQYSETPTPVETSADAYQNPVVPQQQAAPVNQAAPQQAAPQPQLRMPTSIVVCRSKQCAPAKLSTSKEYIYNTLLHMFDSNAREKALVCTGDANTHACTEEFVSIPVTVGITPAYMYIDDVKITDVSMNDKNTAAMNLILNWGVSYNGQTPTCRPSKTVLFAKNVNNVIMEDDGYTCKMTTIGTTTIKTLFAIDYIDIDFGFIGGFYSIGLSGPAYGGGSGYMILRLPKDITLNPKDFLPQEDKEEMKVASLQTSSTTTDSATKPMALEQNAPSARPVTPSSDVESAPYVPAPNVTSMIRYNHPSVEYDKAAKRRRESASAARYNGVEVYPLTTSKPKAVSTENVNQLSEYNPQPAEEE